MEPIIDKGRISGLRVVLILPAISIFIALLLNLFYSLPIRDSLLWYVGVFFCFYIPGNLLLRLLDSDKDDYFVNLFHSIALGAALIPLIYTILRRISHPELIYLFLTVLCLIWFIFIGKNYKEVRRVYTFYLNILSVLILLSIIFLLLHFSYFKEIIFMEQGFRINVSHMTETEFHLNLIEMLRNVFPPFFPYASGFDFSHYHLFMHLEIEMFNRLFLINTLKLTYFYFPFLYFLLLVFMPYMIVSKCNGSRIFGVLVGILMFGSDLSFIPGFLGKLPFDFQWTLLINATVAPLLTLNTFLPALFIMFLCILYLKKFFENGKLAYLIVFAVLGFSAYGFKSPMGLHIMSASFLTGIVSVVIENDRKGKVLCFFSAFCILAIVIDVIFFRGGIGSNVYAIELFTRFRDSLAHLGISGMPWYWYPAGFILYLFAAFSVRVFGFFFLKNIFQSRRFDSVIVFLIIFVISGFFLAEMIFIGYDNPLKAFRVNNAMWFSFQSLMASWLLLPYAISRMKTIRIRFLTIVLIVLISAPGTVQFLWLCSKRPYVTITPSAMDAVKYLEDTPSESVILHPLETETSVVSNLSGRPSVLSLAQPAILLGTVGTTELFKRLENVGTFLNPETSHSKRSSILKKYNVDYILVLFQDSKYLDGEPMLSKVFKNTEYVIYRVESFED